MPALLLLLLTLLGLQHAAAGSPATTGAAAAAPDGPRQQQLPGDAAGQEVARVSSEQQLLAAVLNPRVSLIELQRSITLTSRVWAGHPTAELRRDLTISGPLPPTAQDSAGPGAAAAAGVPGSFVYLDLGYLRDKLALAPHVCLTLQRLDVRRSYSEWVPGVHFCEYAPAATVRLVNAMRALPACPPDLEWLRSVVQEHSLPPGYQPPPADVLAAAAGAPGRVSNPGVLPQPFSNKLQVLNSSECGRLYQQPLLAAWPSSSPPSAAAAAAGGGGNQDSSIPHPCIHPGMLVSRLAYEVPRQPDRRRAHAFAGIDEAFDSYFYCESVLPQSCLERHGFPACFTAATTAAAARHRWRGRLPQLLLGMVATLAAVLLPAAWWWQQQQQQQLQTKQKQPMHTAAKAAAGHRSLQDAAAPAAAAASVRACIPAPISVPAAAVALSSEADDFLADLPLLDEAQAGRFISIPEPVVSPGQAARKAAALPPLALAQTAAYVGAGAAAVAASGSAERVTDSAGSLTPASLASNKSAAAAAGSEADEAAGDPLTGLVCGPMIGVGSQGRVYKSDWRGRTVAVKVMEVRRTHDFKSVRHELAINKLLQHPNVVQCLAYKMQLLDASLPSLPSPGTGAWSGIGGGSSVAAESGSASSLDHNPWGGSGGGGSSSSGSGGNSTSRAWTQVLLVLEYCDGGSLQEAIMDGLLRRPGNSSSSSSTVNNMLSVLRMAKDVATGMAHIHCRNCVHGDLCSKNVLLTSTPDVPPPLSVRAKCADFGLSRLLPEARTHLSTLTHGTLTHMAPELLLNHRLRPAADVYSFGILLWELVHLGLPVPPGSAAAAAAASGGGLLGARMAAGLAAQHGAAGSSGNSSGGSGGHPQMQQQEQGPATPPAASSDGRSGSAQDAAAAAVAGPAAAIGGTPDPASPPPAASPLAHGNNLRFTHAFQHLGLAPSPWAIMQHVINGGRPVFAAGPAVPGPYVALAQRCWHQQPEQRPGFDEIVGLLEGVLQGPAADDHVGVLGSF